MAFGLSSGAASLIGSVAAPVVSGLINSGSASNAAGIQAGATDRANAISQQQYDQIRRDNSTFLRNGTSASNKLAQLLGLGDPNASIGGFTPMTLEQFSNSTSHADSAATRADYENYLANNPATAGQAADPSTFGSLTKNFTGADLQNEPGYQFGLTQGQLALDNKAAAGGRYFSGAALKGATQYAQDYAGTKYGDAFNRDASQKNQTYNFLSGTANTGLNAANMTGSAGTAMANTVGANTTALGNSMGASQIAQGNALSNGLTNAANGYQQNQLTQAILGGNRGFGSGGTFTIPTNPYAGYSGDYNSLGYKG